MPIAKMKRWWGTREEEKDPIPPLKISITPKNYNRC
jgi:hypothetical protein